MMKSLFIVGIVFSLAFGCASPPRSDTVLKGQALRRLREVWRATATDARCATTASLSVRPTPRCLPAIGMAGEALLFDAGVLRAVRLRDGVELWRGEIQWKHPVQIGETVDDLVLYGIGKDGELRVLDRRSGRERMSRRGLPEGALVVDGGRAYLVNETHLSVYDLATLRTLWGIDYPSGQRLLAFHVSGRSIALEMFHEGFGYARVFGIDYLGGGVRWDALGRIGALSGDSAYLMKHRYAEVWARNAQSGKLVETARLDRCDGRFLAVDGEDFLYTSEQRYYDPVDIVVDDGTATPVVRRVNIVRELIRSSPSTGKTLWNIPIPVSCADGEEWTMLPFHDEIVAAIKDPAVGYTHMAAMEKKSGKMAWSILAPGGIASADASRGYVLAAYRGGLTVCYRVVNE